MQGCRTFRERVGPRILLLESVDYFGTSECITENFDGEAIDWSGVVNFHCVKMQPEYQAFLGKRGKMEAKKEER